MRDPEHTAIKASDVTIGSVFHVLPESIKESQHVLEDKAKAAVLLMRLEPDDIKVAKARDWGYEGIVAYSKICTHRLPRRPLRAADPPPAVPVSPVDLRRDAGLQGHLRPGEASASAAEDHC